MANHRKLPMELTGLSAGQTIGTKDRTYTRLTMNLFVMGIVAQGWARGLFGGRPYHHPAGALGVSWHGIGTQHLDASEDVHSIAIFIPVNWMLERHLPRGMTHRLFEGRVIWSRAALDAPTPRLRTLAQQHIQDMKRWLHDLTRGDADHQRTAELEIEACLRRMALAEKAEQAEFNPRPLGDDQTPERYHAAEQMAGFIADHYRQPITVDDIADAVNLSAEHATRLFKQALGRTLHEQLTQHRLSHALRRLLVSEDSILQIALSSGFGSQSQFYEVFTRTVGCSPRRYRMQEGRKVPVPTRESTRGRNRYDARANQVK